MRPCELIIRLDNIGGMACVISYNNIASTQNSTTTSKLFTLAIILSPILEQYIPIIPIPGVRLGDLVLGVSCVLLLLTSKLDFSVQKVKPLVLFWFFGATVSFFSFLIQQELNFEIISRLIRYSFYVFLVLVSSKYFQLKYALRIFKFLCIIISLYIIAQVIIWNVFGFILPFKILPIPLGRNISLEDITLVASKYYLRAPGIFVEPGYAAQFLLPGLALSLFGWLKTEKADIKTTMLIFSALILSTSSLGIFLGALAIGIYFVMVIVSNKSYAGLFRIFIIIPIIIVIVVLLLNLDIIQISINKVTGEVRAGGSVALRIYRGYAIFFQLPLLYKLIGVGHGNLGNFVIENSVITKYDSNNMTSIAADYVNGISAVGLYYGIIGIVILFYLYINIVKKTKGVFRLIAIIYIALNLVEGAIFNITALYYLSFIYSGYYISAGFKINPHIGAEMLITRKTRLKKFDFRNN